MKAEEEPPYKWAFVVKVVEPNFGMACVIAIRSVVLFHLFLQVFCLFKKSFLQVLFILLKHFNQSHFLC